MASPDNEDLTPAQRAQLIKQRASELGFPSCGITDLQPPAHQSELRRWLDSGMAGTMTYMNRQATKRANPALIVPEATRAVVVTRPYDHPSPDGSRDRGKVAKYARGADYHDVLQTPLTKLAHAILEMGDGTTLARAFVDAGPVPERELAQRAGLGWIGKNTMLIDPRMGSFFFIAEILTNLDIELDAPFEADRCGTCTRCLEACPTGAFPEERILDARECISYLTIEYKGPFDHDQQGLHGWVFGCDECQTVCPWNIRFSEPVDDPLLQCDVAMTSIDLVQMSEMNAETFDATYGRTPFARPGLTGMRRNAQSVLDDSP